MSRIVSCDPLTAKIILTTGTEQPRTGSVSRGGAFRYQVLLSSILLEVLRLLKDLLEYFIICYRWIAILGKYQDEVHL